MLLLARAFLKWSYDSYFQYMIVILLYALTELGYVLNVMIERKENVVLKSSCWKEWKLNLNGLVERLFYAINLNIHLFNFRQIDRHISSVLIFLSYHISEQTILQIFGVWHQEIDLSFTNHEPLIPTIIIIWTLVWML